MVHGLRDLRRWRWAVDGEIGRVSDVYFEETSWSVRYLVVRTNCWRGRTLLICRGEQDDPPSSQAQCRVVGDAAGSMASTVLASSNLSDSLRVHDEAASQLHSAREVIGYDVRGIDGRLGRAEELLFDLQMWSVRYLVVNSGFWRWRRRILVRPGLIEDIDWFHRCARVQLRREDIGLASGSGQRRQRQSRQDPRSNNATRD